MGSTANCDGNGKIVEIAIFYIQAKIAIIPFPLLLLYNVNTDNGDIALSATVWTNLNTKQ